MVDSLHKSLRLILSAVTASLLMMNIEKQQPTKQLKKLKCRLTVFTRTQGTPFLWFGCKYYYNTKGDHDSLKLILHLIYPILSHLLLPSVLQHINMILD